MRLRVLHVVIVCLAMTALACSSAFTEPLVADVALVAGDPPLTDPLIDADETQPSVRIGSRHFHVRNSWTEPTEDEVLQIIRDSLQHGTNYHSVFCYSRSEEFSLRGYKMSSGYLVTVDLSRNVTQGVDTVLLELIGRKGARPIPDPEADWVVRALTPPTQVTPDGFSPENCDPELLEILGRNEDGTLASEP